MAELASEDIRYIPLTFSCYGRFHPEAQNVLTSIAQRVAQRKGIDSHHGILRRALGGIGVQIWTRAAKMLSTCLPRASPEELAGLFGEQGDSDDSSDEDTEVEDVGVSMEDEA